MDAPTKEPDSAPVKATREGSLAERRERMQALSAARRERLAALEARILERLDNAARALTQAEQDTAAKDAEVEQKAAEIDRRRVELDNRTSKLDECASDLKRRSADACAADADIEQRRAELDTRARELEAAAAKLHRDEDITVSAAKEAADEWAQLKQRATERLSALDREQADLAEEHARTKAQRRRIADRLQSAHQELLAERVRCDTASASAASDDVRTRELVAQLTAERDDLIRRLAAAEQALAAAAQRSPTNQDADHDRELADLTQRYDMAVRDIRELKKQNEEMSKRSASRARPAAAPGESMDWEARKRQLLESLAEDDADDDEAQRSERRQVEEVVRTTDAVLAEKQQEIDALKLVLSNRDDDVRRNEESTPVETAADTDEIVLQQRERVKQLEIQWEAKLRQAEIEMSVQRAQLARTQAQLEERQRALDEQRSRQAAPQGTGDTSGKPKKAVRGRWLSRLGLNDDEG